MAEIVCTLGVPHTPLLWRALQPDVPDDLADVAAWFGRMRDMLDEARPDTLVMVGSDHFRQFTTRHMPAFLVGKATRLRGTHPNEVREFGLPPVWLDGDEDLARELLGRHELPTGFDFSFSDEPWLDHAFMIPLLYLRPELDLPVVPIVTNTNAPPLPAASRFAELGRYLRTRLSMAGDGKRVAIVGTGHLSFELGGPRQFTGASPDPDFDDAAIRWMDTADVAGAVAACTFDRLFAAGNLTFQFLNFISLMTAAGERPASAAAAVDSRFGGEPFFAWTGETG